MAKLTSDEIFTHRAWFQEWHAPRDVLDYVDSVNDRIGSTDFFRQGGLTFLRDAWVAGELGEYRSADTVRLCSENWPDCEIRVDGGIEPFEITEADDEERRRGDEYRDSEASGERYHDYPEKEWIRLAERAPYEINRVTKKKVEKGYPPNEVSLCIHLNLMEFGTRQTEVESCFAESTESGKDHFREIWVLWKAKAYRVWP